MTSSQFTAQPQKICERLQIRYPIIQAGMVWTSGANLAIAASKAGCLGVLGAGSLKGDLLKKHICKVQDHGITSFAVNVPIMYEGSADQIKEAYDLGVRCFILSAGSPKIFTPWLKERHATVIHVTATPRMAKKCEDAGVDIVVVEGFEAGGHNGRNELTSMVLIPQVKKQVSIPVLAAGGIASGKQMYAAMALGADGVQIGSRFAATQESSAHPAFKQAICEASPEDTQLKLRAIAPVRLLKNPFFHQVEQLETSGASAAELKELLGKGRAKAGMFEGDLHSGELEIGQVSGMIDHIPTCQTLVDDIIKEYHQTAQHMANLMS